MQCTQRAGHMTVETGLFAGVSSSQNNDRDRTCAT